MPNAIGDFADALAPGLQVWAQRGYEEHQKKKIADALAAAFGHIDAPNTSAPAPVNLGGPMAPPQQPQAAPPQPHPAAGLAGLGAMGKQDPRAMLAQAAPPPQPAPQAGPPPGQPTGAPGAEAPTGMSATIPDPAKEGESIIQNMFNTIKGANPKADNLTVLEAVEKQLDLVKGIAPVTKATMQGQIAGLNIALKSKQFGERMDELIRKHNLDHDDKAYQRDTQMAIAQLRGDVAIQTTEMRDSTSERNTDARDATSVRTTGMRDDTSRENTDARDSTSRANSGDRSDDSTYRADQSVRGAQVRAGGDPGPAPVRAGADAAARKWAAQNGLTLVRKRADGGWDAKDKNGRVGVVHPS